MRIAIEPAGADGRGTDGERHASQRSHLGFGTRGAGLDRPNGTAGSWRVALERYLLGWAAGDPYAVMQATEPGYRFNDPLVGLFTRWSLPAYFDALKERLGAAEAIEQGDCAVMLHGPEDDVPSPLGLRFRREIPRLGLSGMAHIQVGRRGVLAESVTYEIDPARALSRPSARA